MSLLDWKKRKFDEKKLIFFMLNSQISNEGVEDDEHTITMVEDVISMLQISQQSFQPLAVEEEALFIENDLQAPQDPLV